MGTVDGRATLERWRLECSPGTFDYSDVKGLRMSIYVNPGLCQPVFLLVLLMVSMVVHSSLLGCKKRAGLLGSDPSAPEPPNRDCSPCALAYAWPLWLLRMFKYGAPKEACGYLKAATIWTKMLLSVLTFLYMYLGVVSQLVPILRGECGSKSQMRAWHFLLGPILCTDLVRPVLLELVQSYIEQRLSGRFKPPCGEHFVFKANIIGSCFSRSRVIASRVLHCFGMLLTAVCLATLLAGALLGIIDTLVLLFIVAMVWWFCSIPAVCFNLNGLFMDSTNRPALLQGIFPSLASFLLAVLALFMRTYTTTYLVFHGMDFEFFGYSFVCDVDVSLHSLTLPGLPALQSLEIPTFDFTYMDLVTANNFAWWVYLLDFATKWWIQAFDVLCLARDSNDDDSNNRVQDGHQSGGDNGTSELEEAGDNSPRAGHDGTNETDGHEECQPPVQIGRSCSHIVDVDNDLQGDEGSVIAEVTCMGDVAALSDDDSTIAQKKQGDYTSRGAKNIRNLPPEMGAIYMRDARGAPAAELVGHLYDLFPIQAGRDRQRLMSVQAFCAVFVPDGDMQDLFDQWQLVKQNFRPTRLHFYRHKIAPDAAPSRSAARCAL